MKKKAKKQVIKKENTNRKVKSIYIGRTKKLFVSKVEAVIISLCIVICLFLAGLFAIICEGQIILLGILIFVCSITTAIIIWAENVKHDTKLMAIAIIECFALSSCKTSKKQELYFIQSLYDPEKIIPIQHINNRLRYTTKSGNTGNWLQARSFFKKEYKKIHDIMKSQEFYDIVEDAVNDEQEIFEKKWKVQNLKNVKFGKKTLFGTQLIYCDRQGCEKRCFLSRDTENYKEIKEFIEQLMKENDKNIGVLRD